VYKRQPVVAERNKEGEFKSIEDFCRRTDLKGINKRALESLIKAGVLDSLGNRGTLLNNMASIISLSQREAHLRETGQSTMFDLWGETTPLPLPSLNLTEAEVPTREKLTWEKELMGVYLSEHPLSSFVSKTLSEKVTLCGQIDAEMAGQTVIIAGMVASARHLFTRDHRPFASTILEDLDGSIEVMVWPKVYEDTRELWEEGNILLVEGKVRLRDERVQLACDNVRRYQPEAPTNVEATTPQPEEIPPAPETTVETTPREKKRLVINIQQTGDKKGDVDRLNRLLDTLKEFPGRDEVRLILHDGEKVTRLRLASVTTGYCPELHQRLVELVGEDGLEVKNPSS